MPRAAVIANRRRLAYSDFRRHRTRGRKKYPGDRSAVASRVRRRRCRAVLSHVLTPFSGGIPMKRSLPLLVLVFVSPVLGAPRPDVLIAEFEGDPYAEGWKMKGTGFGKGAAKVSLPT